MKSLTKNVSQEFEDVSIITISNTFVRITSKGLIRTPSEPRIDCLIITTSGPDPYSYDKAVPWNYVAEVYYHGTNQEPWIAEEKLLKLKTLLDQVKLLGRGESSLQRFHQ